MENSMKHPCLRSACSLLLFILAVSAAFAATQSDIAKEARWSDQIVDQLVDGEDVWLENDDHRFLAIYTPAETASPSGTVLLIHGTGAHPDWPQIIQPLRSGLAERGWQSLSIQMPLPPEAADEDLQGALIREGAARISAGIDWLSTQNARRVSLISHSRGGADLLFYAANEHDNRLESLVVIGVNGAFGNIPDAMNTLQSLARIRLPVLDVYGGDDIQGIRDTAASRKETARTVSRDYRQVEIAGADHFFEGMDADLLELVVDWLKSHHASNE